MMPQTTENPVDELPISKQREMYIDHITKEKEHLNQRYKAAIDQLDCSLKIYEDWYARQQN